MDIIINHGSRFQKRFKNLVRYSGKVTFNVLVAQLITQKVFDYEINFVD